MKVHSTLGYGFQQVIYQRCMAIEMEKQDLGFVWEEEMRISYEGIHVGTRRADFLVENEIILELKAVPKLKDTHLSQGLNNLYAYNYNKGLLINFGTESLEVKQLYTKAIKNHSNHYPGNPLIL